MSELIFEFDCGLSAVIARKKEWIDLFIDSASNNPFLSWEWTYYWACNYATHDNIRILVGKIDDVVRCIVPLQTDGGDTAFLRDQEYADYGDILIASDVDQAHIQSIIGWLMQDSNKLSLEAMRSDSMVFSLIESLIEVKSIEPVVTYICDNPCVVKTDDFDAYYKTRSKKLRQELRTTENNLKRMGEYIFIEEIQGNSYENFLDKLADFHLERQEVKMGGSIFADMNVLKFFKEAPKYLNTSSCQLHMSAILLNGRIISAALSIKSNDNLYYWIPSFDKDIPKVSLGKLHIKLLIEKCHSQNLAFDFMGGDEKYKYQWANMSVGISSFIFFKSSFRKFLYENKLYLRQQLKQNFRGNRVIKKARITFSKFYS